jgi:poly-gamma-glutamate capsule biosynthesis protein CapA/YwtB (metallophosphatase superfamily)
MDSWVIECDTIDGSDDENTAELLFLGDVALAGRVGDGILQHGSQFLFGNLPSRFFDADVVCYNLECCLSRRGKVWEPKPVPLRGLPEFLSVFPRIGGRYVANVANNHFLDYGEDAALDTLEALNRYDMASMGAIGPDGAGRHVLLETRAGRVALAGFAPSIHPLPHAMRVNVIADRVCDMVPQVLALKAKSDLVIVSLHQGVEHTPYVDWHRRQLAHRLVDAGADCIVCHHPHIIQGIETYNGVQIFHSIGNFVIDSDFTRQPSARKSLALRLILSGGRLRRVNVEPFVIMDSFQPRPATDEENQQISREVRVLSLALASNLGSYAGYLRCEAVKIYGRTLSLREMIWHKGVHATAKYYAQRLKGRARSGERLRS